MLQWLHLYWFMLLTSSLMGLLCFDHDNLFTNHAKDDYLVSDFLIDDLSADESRYKVAAKPEPYKPSYPAPPLDFLRIPTPSVPIASTTTTTTTTSTTTTTQFSTTPMITFIPSVKSTPAISKTSMKYVADFNRTLLKSKNNRAQSRFDKRKNYKRRFGGQKKLSNRSRNSKPKRKKLHRYAPSSISTVSARSIKSLSNVRWRSNRNDETTKKRKTIPVYYEEDPTTTVSNLFQHHGTDEESYKVARSVVAVKPYRPSAGDFYANVRGDPTASLVLTTTRRPPRHFTSTLSNVSSRRILDNEGYFETEHIPTTPKAYEAYGLSYKGRPYSFQYGVKDTYTGADFSRQEKSTGNEIRGKYEVLLPDGRTQIVTYVADENGYQATVTYEGGMPSRAAYEPKQVLQSSPKKRNAKVENFFRHSNRVNRQSPRKRPIQSKQNKYLHFKTKYSRLTTTESTVIHRPTTVAQLYPTKQIYQKSTTITPMLFQGPYAPEILKSQQESADDEDPFEKKKPSMLTFEYSTSKIGFLNTYIDPTTYRPKYADAILRRQRVGS